MVRSKYYLIAGGVITALISILHVILTLQPGLYGYFGPSQESGLAQMAVQGSSATTIATAALALIFAIWALYAFSGSGLIGRLPLLRTALIAIGVIYILRSLFLPSEINMVLNQGYPFRFVVFSTVSLVTGLLYLIGTLTLKQSRHL
jgi:putative oxidoreductase